MSQCSITNCDYLICQSISASPPLMHVDLINGLVSSRAPCSNKTGNKLIYAFTLEACPLKPKGDAFVSHNEQLQPLKEQDKYSPQWKLPTAWSKVSGEGAKPATTVINANIFLGISRARLDPSVYILGWQWGRRRLSSNLPIRWLDRRFVGSCISAGNTGTTGLLSVFEMWHTEGSSRLSSLD